MVLAGNIWLSAAWLISILLPLGVAIHAIHYDRPRIYFGALFLLIALTILIENDGQDMAHHVYRVAVLKEQLLGGYLDAFTLKQDTQELIPTFFFYSFVPYAVPVLLSVAGMDVDSAYKVSMILYWGALLIGTWKLLTYCSEKSGRNDYLYGVMFLTSSYVFSLWVIRSAAAEIVAYTLVPWIVLTILANRKTYLELTLLLALQMSAHPVIFTHCAAATIVAVWIIDPAAFRSTLKRNAVAGTAALVVSAPFWLPPFLFKNTISGTSNLPLAFEDTFLGIQHLLNPIGFRSIGVAQIVLLSFIFYRNITAPTRKMVVLFSIFLLSIILQMEFAKAVSVHIPVLYLSLFVWRLMFVSCFLALMIMIVNDVRVPTRLLVVLCSVAVINTAAVCARYSLPGLPSFLEKSDEHRIVERYFDENPEWGSTEFRPDYSRLPVTCDLEAGAGLTELSAEQARKGMYVAPNSLSNIVAVRKAPWGFVNYRLNGKDIQPSGVCGDKLIFGPTAEAGLFELDESFTSTVMIIRLVIVIAFAIGIFTLLLGRTDFVLRRRSGVKAVKLD